MAKPVISQRHIHPGIPWSFGAEEAAFRLDGGLYQCLKKKKTLPGEENLSCVLSLETSFSSWLKQIRSCLKGNSGLTPLLFILSSLFKQKIIRKAAFICFYNHAFTHFVLFLKQTTFGFTFSLCLALSTSLQYDVETTQNTVCHRVQGEKLVGGRMQQQSKGVTVGVPSSYAKPSKPWLPPHGVQLSVMLPPPLLLKNSVCLKGRWRNVSQNMFFQARVPLQCILNKDQY